MIIIILTRDGGGLPGCEASTADVDGSGRATPQAAGAYYYYY